MIGLHVNGTGGSRGNLGDFIARTAAAGLSPVICCPEDAALAAQVASAGGTAVFRKNSWSGAPSYDLDPFIVAASHLQYIEAHMPPELLPLKHLIWIQFVIEPDKERAEWVLAFTYDFMRLANAAGFRVVGPNWSAGTPEVDAWESEAGLTLLRYLAGHRDVAALGLHEYSLDAGDIKRWFPYLIGRFDFILDVCADNGIARPRIMITECGWSYDDMPGADQALADVAWLAEVYGDVDVCLWTLGQWPQGPGLPPKLAGIVDDLTEFNLAAFKPPDDEDPPMEETFAEHLWRVSVEEQTASGIHVNPDTAINRAIYGEEVPGVVPVTNERRTTYDGQRYAYQVAQDPTDSARRRVYFVAVPSPGQPWGPVQFITGPNGDGHAGLAAPIGTAEERAGGKIWPGNWTDANPYGNAYVLRGQLTYHTGADLNLNAPTWNADKGQPVWACADGKVTYAGRFNENWGNLVVVRHKPQPHAPDGFYARYAHLGRIDVKTGQVLQLGDQLGIVGGADVGLPDHLHFDVSLTRKLAENPGDWPGSSLARLHTDYVDPKAFLEGKVDGGDNEPPTEPAVDMAGYFLPRSGDFGDIVILKNNWGQGDERQQLQREGVVSYVTKNSQYEKRVIGADVITLVLDTSPGDGQYYRVELSTGWMPRHWRPGESFTRKETARFYYKGDCQPTGRVLSGTSDLRFAALHNLYVTRGGLTFENVAEVHWIRNGLVEEKYWYAPGAGLIAWWNRSGRESWAVEIVPVGQQGNNVRESIGCL